MEKILIRHLYSFPFGGTGLGPAAFHATTRNRVDEGNFTPILSVIEKSKGPEYSPPTSTQLFGSLTWQGDTLAIIDVFSSDTF